MAFDNLCVIFPRRGVTGGGWEFGILAPLHQITPHTAWAALFWALFLLIYISTLMPNICFCALFPSISQGSNKSTQIRESADEMQKYGVKMKAEVLDSGWYLFVCWLHMFGFGFRGFAGFPPGRTDTLHSPANTLALSHHYTPTLKMYGISSRVVSLVIISET